MCCRSVLYAGAVVHLLQPSKGGINLLDEWRRRRREKLPLDTVESMTCSNCRTSVRYLGALLGPGFFPRGVSHLCSLVEELMKRTWHGCGVHRARRGLQVEELAGCLLHGGYFEGEEQHELPLTARF